LVTSIDREIKERRFVAYYMVNSGNATRAAILAGYSERSASTIGWRLKNKPSVMREIELDLKAGIEAVSC